MGVSIAIGNGDRTEATRPVPAATMITPAASRRALGSSVQAPETAQPATVTTVAIVPTTVVTASALPRSTWPASAPVST